MHINPQGRVQLLPPPPAPPRQQQQQRGRDQGPIRGHERAPAPPGSRTANLLSMGQTARDAAAAAAAAPRPGAPPRMKRRKSPVVAPKPPTQWRDGEPTGYPSPPRRPLSPLRRSYGALLRITMITSSSSSPSASSSAAASPCAIAVLPCGSLSPCISWVNVIASMMLGAVALCTVGCTDWHAHGCIPGGNTISTKSCWHSPSSQVAVLADKPLP